MLNQIQEEEYNGFQMDFRGIAKLVGYSDMSNIESITDPIKEVLDFWLSQSPEVTLTDLLLLVQQIGRSHDVHEGLKDIIRKYFRSFNALASSNIPNLTN